MKGLIVKNAYMSFEEYDSQAQRLKDEFENLGVGVDIVRNKYCLLHVDDCIHTKLLGYDFCIYLDKDKYLLNGLEKCGMRVFNSYRAIELCDDKMTTYLALANHKVPLPLSIAAPLCYDERVLVDENSAIEIENALGYPLIFKLCYGSRGAGVFLVNCRDELLAKMNKFKCVPHLYQKYLPTSRGKDVRVIVVGDKVLGGMLRSSDSDFRSNVALGGSATAYALDEKTKNLCIEVAKILGLDYCGIDLLFGEDGNFVVCEVNSNAFFHGFERATGVNVAKAYAEYVLKQIK